MKKILTIGCSLQLKVITDLLSKNYQVQQVRSDQAAFRSIKSAQATNEQYDLIITDFALAETSSRMGFCLVRDINELYPQIKIIGINYHGQGAGLNGVIPSLFSSVFLPLDLERTFTPLIKRIKKILDE